MALVVPIRRDGLTQAPSPMQATAPPSDQYLLMAAALMHRDGRLIKPEPKIPDTVSPVKSKDKTPDPELYFPSNGRQDKPSVMT